MNLVRNLTWRPSSFSYQHFAFLRRLQVPYRAFELGMLKYLGSRKGCPGPRQCFTTYVLQRFTDMLLIAIWVTSKHRTIFISKGVRGVVTGAHGAGLARVR